MTVNVPLSLDPSLGLHLFVHPIHLSPRVPSSGRRLTSPSPTASSRSARGRGSTSASTGTAEATAGGTPARSQLRCRASPTTAERVFPADHHDLSKSPYSHQPDGALGRRFTRVGRTTWLPAPFASLRATKIGSGLKAVLSGAWATVRGISTSALPNATASQFDSVSGSSTITTTKGRVSGPPRRRHLGQFGWYPVPGE